jgi:FkbM family methyltransferase
MRSGRIGKPLRFMRKLRRRELLRGRFVLPLGEIELGLPLERLWAFADGDYYERNVAFWFDRLLNNLSSPIVYDIGANVGYYTVKAAGRAEAVYAFEPVRSTLAWLEENVSRNRLQNVTSFPLALADSEGSAEINIYDTSGNNSLYADAGMNLAVKRRELVEKSTIDGLVARGLLRPPDLIKLDVEGGELPVLRGGTETITLSLPLLIIEFNTESTTAAGYRPDEIEDELTKHGYSLYGLSANVNDMRLYPRSEWPLTSIANVVAFPPQFEGKRVGLT